MITELWHALDLFEVSPQGYSIKERIKGYITISTSRTVHNILRSSKLHISQNPHFSRYVPEASKATHRLPVKFPSNRFSSTPVLCAHVCARRVKDQNPFSRLTYPDPALCNVDASSQRRNVEDLPRSPGKGAQWHCSRANTLSSQHAALSRVSTSNRYVFSSQRTRTRLLGVAEWSGETAR